MTKKAILVWGGWDGHEPKETVEIAKNILIKEDIDVEVFDNMDIYTDKEKMAGVDLIVPCWTAGEMTPEQSAGLREAVASGVGLAGWHGGLCDAFRGDTEYQFMTGGQWVAHPGNIIKYTVNITSNDPIVAGIKDFEMESEQYYMHTDPSNEVLAITTFSGEGAPWINGCVMPVIWKRMWASGKIFYMSVGHVASDFNVPALPEILKRGMMWAMK